MSTTTSRGSQNKYIPEDKDQFIVQTPYGRGLVVRTRGRSNNNESTTNASNDDGDDGDNNDTRRTIMREIQLTDWENAAASSSSPGPRKNPKNVTTLYSPTDFPSIEPSVGDDVMCLYGRGRVIEIREQPKQQGSEEEEDQENPAATSAAAAASASASTDTTTSTTATTGSKIFVVRISSWRLANRSVVTCYLQAKDIRVVRHYRPYEMSVFERVEHAQSLKDSASKLFVSKKFFEALQIYASAVDTVRYIQHKKDSSNYIRADLLVLMITCSNNAATCCIQLQQFDRTYNFANSALALIDALDKKKKQTNQTTNGTTNGIIKVLRQDGYKDIVVFGVWRIKSMIHIGRALFEKQEYNEAMDILKRAHEIVASYTTTATIINEAKQIVSLGKEVKRLHSNCKEQKKLILKKEKQRAQAMFASSSSSPSKKKEKNGEVNGEGKKSPTKKLNGMKPKNGINTPKTTTTTTTPTKSKSKSTRINNKSILKSDNGDNDSNGSKSRKSVDFAEGTKDGSSKEDNDDNNTEDGAAWYDEHFELLILTAGLVVTGLGSWMLMKRR